MPLRWVESVTHMGVSLLPHGRGSKVLTLHVAFHVGALQVYFAQRPCLLLFALPAPSSLLNPPAWQGRFVPAIMGL